MPTRTGYGTYPLSYAPPVRLGGDPKQSYMYEEKQQKKMLNILLIAGSGVALFFLLKKFKVLK